MKTFLELEEDYKKALDDFKEIDMLFNSKVSTFFEDVKSDDIKNLMQQFDSSLGELLTIEGLYIQSLQENFPENSELLNKVQTVHDFRQKLYALLV
ncbi:MAG TPA: hypothetical protein PLJ37_00745 [Chitinophagales bacterium]|nr:hypothetical protein [Chitinophagales bacterium]HMW93479.1 hypothetical protein [Chitinophagales bacterium]HMZ92898.1 hypothetical protein [Chitinophagales bacterium]HNG25913.1 hypothetical protein [Chitinophagales bacterium]